MLRMKWGWRGNLVVVCLAIALILVPASLTPLASAQSETTPEATGTPGQVTPTPVPDQSPGESDPSDESTASDASTSPLLNSILDWGPDQWIDVAISLLYFLVIA
ncbi:MAG: hypothetical protein ACK2UG_09155, partial [Candidatus Promineifilaceae bacterium]